MIDCERTRKNNKQHIKTQLNHDVGGGGGCGDKDVYIFFVQSISLISNKSIN